MADEPRTAETRSYRTPWNKGELTGPKPPLKVRDIKRAIRMARTVREEGLS
jgi:hypothetical protein